jgi:hypothetical protein
VRHFFVSLILVVGFALFLLIPEERRGEWLLTGDDVIPTGPATEAPPRIDEADPAFEPVGPRQTLAGRVQLPTGEGVARVTVRLEHAWVPEVHATTDAEGRFELTPEEPRGELAVVGSEWFFLGGDRIVSPDRVDGYVLAVAAPIFVNGRVVGSQGEPIAAADVRSHTPPDVLVPLGIASLPLPAEGQVALTDAEGRFRLGPLPDVAGLELEIAADGQLTRRLPAGGATSGAGEVVIALEPEPEPQAE